ncbi:hypothetical protein GCM10022384_59600 [Streptomyces marokkonensis]|uniref:Condensation domain-containing protein n=1 Tax=Streptomyces marokkonensis TaxID=324855 RepID=A0ABP7S1N1_9ACTN
MPENVSSDTGRIPLSSRQDWCWEWTRSYDPASYSMDLTWALRLRGSLDVGALRDAVAEVTSRHDALRLALVTGTAHPLDDPRPVQRVTGGYVPLDVVGVGASHSSEEAIDRITSLPLDLTGPLVRLTLIRLAPDEHVFVLAFHHMVFDGASRRILMRELTEAYNRRMGAMSTPAPTADFSYVDFARRDNAPDVLASKRLRVADRARVLREHGSAEPLGGTGVALSALTGDYRLIPMTFTTGQVTSIRRSARAARISVYSLLLAALVRSVGEVYGRDRLVGTTIAHGRTEAGSTSAIGLFCAPVEMAFDLGVRDPADFLHHVHGAVRHAANLADLPSGEKASSVLVREGDDAFFRTCLSHLDFRLTGITGLVLDRPDGPIPFHGLDARLWEYPRTFPELIYASAQAARGNAGTLFLDLRMSDGELTGFLCYEAGYHDESSVRAVADLFRRLTVQLPLLTGRLQGA